jgi:HK97 family phage portal protein
VGFFTKKKPIEKREGLTLDELLLQASLGVESVTKEQALNIPSLAGCVDIIASHVAMLPIQLYSETDGKVNIVKGDNRVKLLNDDTKDTLNAYQFKKQLVEDYLLTGVGYAYINKQRNNIASLNYVDSVSVGVVKNADPIFKDYNILVNGTTYRPFEFLKFTRKTKDGVTGKGIVAESNDILTVSYQTLKFEKLLFKTGGNKKGFLKAQKRLTDDALTALKTAWNNLYKDSSDNVIILNDGLEFQEVSTTQVEMQLNESKQTNSFEICKLFNVPIGLLEGKVTSDEYNNFIKICILPILKAFENAINKDLLLESEKGSFYFAFDTKELMKGNVLERFQAYEVAIKNGFMQWDEVRYIEDLEPYGLDFIKLGLQDVLYNPKTKEVYTPNTNKTANMDGEEVKTEDEDENRNPE